MYSSGKQPSFNPGGLTKWLPFLLSLERVALISKHHPLPRVKRNHESELLMSLGSTCSQIFLLLSLQRPNPPGTKAPKRSQIAIALLRLRLSTEGAHCSVFAETMNEFRVLMDLDWGTQDREDYSWRLRTGKYSGYWMGRDGIGSIPMKDEHVQQRKAKPWNQNTA